MLASARDGRQVDRATATVWADDLDGVSYVDAVDAAKLHYRESERWLMPAHVLQNVKRLRPKVKDDTKAILADLDASRARSVPMPESLRSQLFGGADV